MLLVPCILSEGLGRSCCRSESGHHWCRFVQRLGTQPNVCDANCVESQQFLADPLKYSVGSLRGQAQVTSVLVRTCFEQKLLIASSCVELQRAQTAIIESIVRHTDANHVTQLALLRKTGLVETPMTRTCERVEPFTTVKELRPRRVEDQERDLDIWTGVDRSQDADTEPCKLLQTEWRTGVLLKVDWRHYCLTFGSLSWILVMGLKHANVRRSCPADTKPRFGWSGKQFTFRQRLVTLGQGLSFIENQNSE